MCGVSFSVGLIKAKGRTILSYGLLGCEETFSVVAQPIRCPCTLSTFSLYNGAPGPVLIRLRSSLICVPTHRSTFHQLEGCAFLDAVLLGAVWAYLTTRGCVRAAQTALGLLLVKVLI